MPSGNPKKLARKCRSAFWDGSEHNKCQSFACKPTFRLNTTDGSVHNRNYYKHGAQTNHTTKSSGSKLRAEYNKYSKFYTNYQHEKGNTNYTYSKADQDIAKTYYDYYMGSEALMKNGGSETTTTKWKNSEIVGSSSTNLRISLKPDKEEYSDRQGYYENNSLKRKRSHIYNSTIGKGSGNNNKNNLRTQIHKHYNSAYNKVFGTPTVKL